MDTLPRGFYYDYDYYYDDDDDDEGNHTAQILQTALKGKDY